MAASSIAPVCRKYTAVCPKLRAACTAASNPPSLVPRSYCSCSSNPCSSAWSACVSFNICFLCSSCSACISRISALSASFINTASSSSVAAARWLSTSTRARLSSSASTAPCRFACSTCRRTTSTSSSAISNSKFAALHSSSSRITSSSCGASSCSTFNSSWWIGFCFASRCTISDAHSPA